MKLSQSLYNILKGQEESEEPSNTGFSLEKWQELGKNGVPIPMKIPLHGSSMVPLIRSEKDMVTVMPLVREPMVGDIVLFCRADGKKIVHRVYRVFPDGVQTWGDNCQRADAPIKREAIYGIIVSMEKDGKTYQLDTEKQRAYGIRWMRYGRPAWMTMKKIKAIGRMVIRTVFPDTHKDHNSVQE